MTDKHAQEPWRVETHENYSVFYSEGNGKWIFHSDDVSDDVARRIIACVNACVGIETETLETLTGQKPSLCDLVIAEWRRQCDAAEPRQKAGRPNADCKATDGHD